MAGRRDDWNDHGEPYDGSHWVPVGRRDRWRPTLGERVRALVILLVGAGVLLSIAAVAGLGGDDDRDVASDTTVATTTTTSTTTTTIANANSLDGAPPPERCTLDDRGAEALRERDDVTVLVLNGTNRSGHAGRVTDFLEDADYDSEVPANGGTRRLTSVQYTPGFCAEADRLTGDILNPEADFRPVNPDEFTLGRADIVVVLGRDSLTS